MSDIDINSPAVADTAILEAPPEAPASTNGHHHPEPATPSAEILEHNAPQPAIPDGTTTGAAPAKMTDTQPNAIPSKGSVSVKDRKHKPAGRDRGNLTIIDPNIKLGGGYSAAERAEL